MFIGALALLGALARRAGGQPVMSRQRRWRVAFGIVLIALLVVLALLFGASGGSQSGGVVDRGTTTSR